MQFIITIFICLGILFFLPILFSFKIVRQNQVAIVERLGKFSRIIHPGINFLIPYIEKTVATIDLAIKNMIFVIDTVSSDKVMVKLKANLIFSIDKASVYSFYYNLKNPIETLKSYVENYVRSFVSTESH